MKQWLCAVTLVLLAQLEPLKASGVAPFNGCLCWLKKQSTFVGQIKIVSVIYLHSYLSSLKRSHSKL